MDRDTRTLIQKFVVKYDEYIKWQRLQRMALIGPTARQLDGMPRAGQPSDRTAEAAERLGALEDSLRVRVIRAIDDAKLGIGADYADEEQRQALRKAIWLSCQQPREFPFEAFAGLIACERRNFYERKNEFLCAIRDTLGI